MDFGLSSADIAFLAIGISVSLIGICTSACYWAYKYSFGNAQSRRQRASRQESRREGRIPTVSEQGTAQLPSQLNEPPPDYSVVAAPFPVHDEDDPQSPAYKDTETTTA